MELLSFEELRRYDRQIRLPEIGIEGQDRLRQSSVLLIGAGGLGSPVALYLAGAGVGRISLVDGDKVDISNLHRQILYRSADERSPKTEVAKDSLAALNPQVKLEAHAVRFSEETAETLTQDHHLFIDASDNFKTRALLNAWSLKRRVPLVQASLLRFEGQLAAFDGLGGPCYRCLYPELPEAPNCAEAGVLGPLVGIFGSYQALEAIKILVLGERYPFGQMLRLDALKNRWSSLKINADPECPSCQGRKREKVGTMNLSRNEMQVSATELSDLLKENAVELLDVREPDERALANIGGHFIPLGDLTQRVHELNPKTPLVVYCHHGIRSMQAVGFLRQMGFENVKNLKGGIEAWSREVDPQIPRY